MSVFKNRRLLVGIATFVIVVAAAAVIWGVPRVWKRNITIKSQVNAYLLDDRGAVNGLLLASGDQLHFSPQTGTVVASQIKIGDEVSATGHAGTQTSYGREVRVEQIAANGQTIVEVHGGRPGKHDRDHERDHERDHGPKDHADRERTPGQSDAPVTMTKPEDQTAVAAPGGSTVTPNAAPATGPLPEPTPETIKVNGTIRVHLLNGHGDVDGLILSTGEQVRLSPKAGKLVVSAEQGSTTPVSVEGTVVRSERGVVLRPTSITVGNQTITLSR